MKDGKRVFTKRAEEEKMNAEEEQSLTHLIRENTEDSFGPYFSSRVMNRINSRTSEDAFTQALVWLFRRVAVTALVLIVALTAYNVSTQHSLGNNRSTLEKALALPPVTLEISIDSYTGDL